MSFWFIAKCRLRLSTQDAAILFETGGLPDLSKALSRDHLREWVKHVNKGNMPELIDDITDRYWKIMESLHRDDYVLALKDKDTLALGEISGDYRYEGTASEAAHCWPVRWVATDIPLAAYKSVQLYGEPRFPKGIPESEARVTFRKYLPSWQTKGYIVFRWVSVIILVAELVYFWPKK